MANVSPAIVVITSTTGPGQAVTSVRFADVVDVEYDFVKNTIKVTRSGAGGITYYDYSATATITQVITAGVTTITIS
jgi:hypothetical protein